MDAVATSRGLLRTLFVLAIGVAAVSCRGGYGALPPTPSRRIQSSAVAPGLKQWNSGSQFAPASITVSWPSSPAAGDLLLVAFWNNGQTSAAANTYAPPAGWTLVDESTSHAYATYQVYSHVAAAGEANTYAFTPLAAQREHAWIAADIAGVTSVDKGASQFVNNGTAYTTPSVTPAQSGDLAIALNLPMSTSALTWSNPIGWNTGIGPALPWPGEALYQTISSTSAVSENSTLSAAASGFSAIVLFAPSIQSTPSPTPSPTPAPTPPSGGTVRPAQWTSGALYAPASLTVSWPNLPSVGDLLVVAFWNNGQTSGSANTYTPPAGWSLAEQNSSTYSTYEVFSHFVRAGESNAYAFMPAAAQREHSWIGVDLVNASGIDKTGDNFINSVTQYATPALTPSQSGDLSVAFDLPMTTNTLSWTNPANWTLGTGSSTGWHGEALYQTLTSGASVSESSTLSVAASGFSGLVMIAPSSVQPSPIVPTASPTPAPTPTPTSGPNADWSTFGYDLQRTGYNPGEKTIGTGSFGTLHPLWSTSPSVGNYLQGQPIVASNVNVGGTNRNLIYAGGIAGKFYAFDASTGSLVWSKQLGTGSYVCPDRATGSWGVEGAAALDRARNRIYVPDGANNVHALDLATGTEATGWPVNVAAVTSHDFIHVAMTYNANNGLLYAETSSPCDNSPWHGRIVAVNTSSAALVNTFYPNQGAGGGSVWGVGGASIDPSTNDVFIATGNADASAQSENYSEHIVELSADLSAVIASSYPANMPFMYDSDFGATPLLFQPVGCPPLLAAVNKSGAFLLYNRSNIAAGPIQEITMAGTGSEFRGVPSYDPVTNYVYVGLPDSQGIYLPGIGAFSITAACTLNPTPVWNGTFGATKDQRSPITIANGVAYVGAYNENTVYAFDAASGARLWSASLSNSGQIAPIILNGRLYVGDIGGTIHAWAP